MKISLGSVQFGNKYGINNQTGIPNDEQINEILSLAESHQIRLIDTASAYGNSEERLGNLSGGKFEFVSKFQLVTKYAELEKSCFNTLQNLKVDSLYGYMAHQANFILDQPDNWKVLEDLKQQGKILKIGYSLYYPDQLKELLDLNCIPDIVQIPYSLLDRKFEESILQLASLQTEVHVRSVFLQGLYLMDPLQFPDQLASIRPSIEQLGLICDKYQIQKSALALSFAVHHQGIGKVVIGVDTARQLKQNLEAILPIELMDELREQILDITVEQPELLNPANW